MRRPGRPSTFALKYEGLDLAVLKGFFLKTGPGPIEAIVREKTTGSYTRRIWFLYVLITGARLDLPDAEAGRYVSVVDQELQWAAPGETAPRYRVKNNLLGGKDFCPLVFRSEALSRFVGSPPGPARTGHRRRRSPRSPRLHGG